MPVSRSSYSHAYGARFAPLGRVGRPNSGRATDGARVSAALGYYGYVSAVDGEAQRQTEAALDGIHTATAVLPAVFFLAALLTMATYPLTEKRHAEIMEQIRARGGGAGGRGYPLTPTRLHRGGDPAPMSKPVVTIFELYGSGASEVGPKVAEALGVPWEPQAFSLR